MATVTIESAGDVTFDSSIAAGSLVQLAATDHMRGRVMSIYNIAFRGGMPIGSLVTGALVPSLGAPAVVGAYGVALALLAAYFLAVRRRLLSL